MGLGVTCVAFGALFGIDSSGALLEVEAGATEEASKYLPGKHTSDSDGFASCASASELPGSFNCVTKAVSSGSYTACALNTAGEVTCWGLCNDGKCLPPANTLFDDIEAADNHICGQIRGLNVMVCWGSMGSATAVP